MIVVGLMMVVIFLLIPDRTQRCLHLLIAFDQFVFCVLTAGVAAPDETASAAAYRMDQEGKIGGRIFRPIIDWIFRPWGKFHCYMAYRDEMQKLQLPLSYRK